MLTLVWAELLRLRRPLLYWSIALGVGLSTLFVSEFLIGARRNFGNAGDELVLLREGPTKEVCEYVEDGSGRPCETLLAERVANARRNVADLKSLYRLRGAIASPFGAGGLAAGFTASMPGLVCLMLIASGHVSGEWARGVAGPRFSRDPRRFEFIVGKSVSLFLGGVLLLFLMAVVLAILGPLLVRLTDMPPPQEGFDPLVFTLRQVPRALLVVAVFSAIGVGISTLVRRPVASLATIAFLVGAAVVASASSASYQWSLASWTSQLMGFERENMLADHVWVDLLPGPMSTVRAALGLGFSAIVALLLAWVRLSRTSLDE